MVIMGTSRRSKETYCVDQIVQGRWSPVEEMNSMNWLDLWGIRMALITLQNLLRKKYVLVCTVSSTAKVHIH